jgi:hypothetical protein
MWRHDPGPCPICGAPHTACTADSGAVVVAQMPARDAQVARTRALAAPSAVPCDPVAPAPETFTTATYRGRARRRR